MQRKVLSTAQNGAQLIEITLDDVASQFKVESPHVAGKDVYLGTNRAEADRKFAEASEA